MTRPPPTRLETRIAASISATGPIGVDAFMAQALYDPQDGYYIVQKPIGVAGDFTTSPEITQIFGELIGLWLAQSWMDLGSPAPFNLVELGPGQGTLMADIMRVGAKVPGFLKAAQVHLVETNVHLRQVQKAKLSAFSPQWHSQLSDVPKGPCLIFGNEFLDCMPIRQFVRGPDGWREKQVGLGTDGRLAFGLGPLLPNPPRNARPDDEIGAVREAAPQLSSFVASLHSHFTDNVGRALLIDYNDPAGHPGDTFQALYRHGKVSPLDHVGAADLTAHVDFSALVRWANATQLPYDGPVSQSTFLRFLGIEARAQTLIAANPFCANDVQAAVERLTSEAHMGALFSVICIDSPLNEGRGPPLGL
jgi:NADH dehydrogenase [ubiquinone] 1 alpha subcomplex assembly factor 7